MITGCSTNITSVIIVYNTILYADDGVIDLYTSL